ncbi:hypothetical protein HanIR_Chr02g0065391 [Helianthus annuus]|nr:hypothetical protein HanIR_Chr02g0065391 [Helianthus annuus]
MGSSGTCVSRTYSLLSALRTIFKLRCQSMKLEWFSLSFSKMDLRENWEELFSADIYKIQN